MLFEAILRHDSNTDTRHGSQTPAGLQTDRGRKLTSHGHSESWQQYRHKAWQSGARRWLTLQIITIYCIWRHIRHTFSHHFSSKNCPVSNMWSWGCVMRLLYGWSLRHPRFPGRQGDGGREEPWQQYVDITTLLTLTIRQSHIPHGPCQFWVDRWAPH